MIRERSGSWFDPELAEVVLSWHDRPAWWQQVRGMSGAVGIQGAEPEDRVLRVDADGLDRVAEAFADVIDAKSPYTSDHSRGVADIARRVGRTLGLEREAGRRLYRAGLLHDIGKLGVSNRILDKPGKLTEQEFNAIRQHPVYSREILGPIEAFADVLQPACLHHERLDGTGYPWGFTGERLTLECRILAGADVFEALSAKRPYRDSLTLDEVRNLMMRDAGHALDGDVLDALFDSSASGPGGHIEQAPAHAMVGGASR
jgi:HD-GYP domain-containing protein (c-di-GMP phosphodiesterase class II)